MPLPDPVGLMKPEPVLIYSQTPVEDIWHNGHPNNAITLIRKIYFGLFHELDTDKQKEWFEYPFFNNSLDKSGEWYYKAKQWYLESWRTPRILIEEARDNCNRYLLSMDGSRL